jgi:hypothetical protein
MQNNYTLKQAVITALTILAVGTQSQALALGLGNIDVKSHLGQPLRASIQIQGAGELKDSTCFKVMNDSNAENQLNSANFKLSKAVDDVAILTVTTNQIINEPIVNLSVMAECDVNMRRDYVLLLDPIFTAELETAADEVPSNTGDFSAETESLTVKAPIQQQTVKVAATSTKKASTKKRKSSKKSNENIVLTAGYDTNQPADKSTTAPSATNNTANTATETKTRLSISAGDAMSLGGTELRLDRALHFTPETAPQALATNTDALDEATVMSHRLAHLEKQLNSLALDNKKLKTENTLKTEQLAQAKSFKNMLDWLSYILGGVLLIVSYTVADKLRRRRQAQQLETAQLAWENANLASANLDEFDAENFIFELDSNADSNQKINNNDKNSAEKPSDFIDEVVPFSVEEFNSEHNVLDHADVFLSHGRTSLAIQLLQNHLLEFPKQSVTIWMFLLDLLTKENLQAVYEQTALECKEYFNVQIAEFSKSENDLNHSLESFPRITAGLQQAWGTPAALVYLDDLIYNSRLEIRVGFHKNVIEELLLLKNVAQEELKSAEVIQLGEKKLAMLELKEAQLNTKKEEKLKQMDEEVLKMAAEKAADAKITPMGRFEFNLIEYK